MNDSAILLVEFVTPGTDTPSYREVNDELAGYDEELERSGL